LPWLSRGSASGDYGVLGVHRRVDDGLLRVAATEDRAYDPAVAAVFGRLLRLHRRGLKESGDHLDVPDLPCSCVHEHVTVLGRTAAVPPLEEVGHHDADLASLAAEKLLHLLGEDGAGGVGFRVVLEALGVEEHHCSFPSVRPQGQVRSWLGLYLHHFPTSAPRKLSRPIADA
jgi:hypothetical protein